MKRLQYILLCVLLLLVAACEKDTLPMNFSPALTTGEASDIYRVGATLSGTIQKSDGVVVQDYGFLISELQSMAEYTEIKTTSTESTFEVMVQNLEPGKKYYYCAYANSGYSIARGEIKEFSTTDSNAPVFSELVVNDKDEKSFTVASTILDEGGSDLILCGFCWKLAENNAAEPTVEDQVSNVSAQSSAISARIKDLTPNKNYLVRAYGINAKGVGYGKTIAVSTNNATVPAVSSITPVDSTGLSVSVKASILSAGESAVTEIGFCWSAENQEPTTANYKYDATGQLEQAEFAYNIEGLTPETTYYIRAYAVNEQGTGYGDVYKFITGKELERVPGIYSSQDLIDFRNAKSTQSDLSKWRNSEGVINFFADVNIAFTFLGSWTGANNDIIEGNGHTVFITEKEPGDIEATSTLFGNNTGIIRNLNIEGNIDVVVTIEGSNVGMGVLCFRNSGTIYNCHSKVNIRGDHQGLACGGICYANEGIVQDCMNYGTIQSSNIGAGIACYNTDGAQIVNCKNYGQIEAISNVYIDAFAGIVAHCDRGGVISGCTNEGKVTSLAFVGGICASAGDNSVVSNCFNTGEVTCQSTLGAGGIVGAIHANNVQVTGCRNEGAVLSEANAGGICGHARGSNIVFTDNTYGGTVNGVAGTEANAVGQDDRQ